MTVLYASGQTVVPFPGFRDQYSPIGQGVASITQLRDAWGLHSDLGIILDPVPTSQVTVPACTPSAQQLAAANGNLPAGYPYAYAISQFWDRNQSLWVQGGVTDYIYTVRVWNVDTRSTQVGYYPQNYLFSLSLWRQLQQAITNTSAQTSPQTLTTATFGSIFPFATRPPSPISCTTLAQTSATYATGAANAITISGYDVNGAAITDVIVLASATGGESPTTTKLFAKVTQILIPAQLLNAGLMTFAFASALSLPGGHSRMFDANNLPQELIDLSAAYRAGGGV